MTTGAGRAMVTREDLATGMAGRRKRRQGLLSFGHLTDLHVVDASSPGRTAFLWQYYEFENGFPASGRFRPQDLLTVHVLDAMVRKMNTVGRGPLSGRPLDLVVSTGDNADGRGTNEWLAVINVMNGRPASAHVAGGEYQGPQDHAWAPEALRTTVWHPDPEPEGTTPDDWKRSYGYPDVPGLLATAIQPVLAAGSSVPWYTGFGNHDELDHGSAAPTSAHSRLVDRLSVGDSMPLALPAGMSPQRFWKELNDSGPVATDQLLASMPARKVRACAQRRAFTKSEFISALFDNPGPHGPAGHGFTAENVANDTTYYTFAMAKGVTGIMLDTTDPYGSAGGYMDRSQIDWLSKQLDGLSSRSYSSRGKKRSSDTEDQLVIIFSHHPSVSFPGSIESSSSSHDSNIDRTGIIDLLSEYPNVILWVNGHQHRNKVWPHASKHYDGGFWEVNTAAHIDYPQQSRTIEVLDNKDGTLSIVATLLDHSDPTSVAYDGPRSLSSLAALSLELAMNRPGLDLESKVGQATDQNVELLVKKPFGTNDQSII
ncbi:TIGR03767 family metallophosphoesterase [Paenarthrobacter sp. Z7-10]|nr:TIGR03767 family metallophosphoesterase [Paenarthrobacter sp. Z7-10]